MISAADAKRAWLEEKPVNYMFMENDATWRDDITTLIQRSAECGFSHCAIEYDTNRIGVDLAEYLESFGYEITADYSLYYNIRMLKVTWAFA